MSMLCTATKVCILRDQHHIYGTGQDDRVHMFQDEGAKEQDINRKALDHAG